MMVNENLLEQLKLILGDNVSIKESPKSEEDRRESLFIETISSLEHIWNVDNKLHEEYGIDLMGFTQHYYHVVENLIAMLFGYDKAEIIWWWVLERFDADGKLLGIETEDGKVHILKTSQQLYKFLKKL